ncbi:MAG: hypothetical protein H0W13_03705 [Nitrospirales bacterium]|nr:hypothetical protein [Nitrospirales bacterium]
MKVKAFPLAQGGAAIFPDGALKRLTMPVMAIVGGKDVIVDSAETKRRMELNVRRAEIHFLPEVGTASSLISGHRSSNFCAGR